MGRPTKEDASGTIDGLNREFSVSSDMHPGRAIVPFVNGQALPGRATATGARTFQLEHAPVLGDTVALYYEAV